MKRKSREGNIKCYMFFFVAPLKNDIKDYNIEV